MFEEKTLNPNQIMTAEQRQAKQELDAKSFSEITTDQKIDRLVEIIEHLQQTLGYQSRTINELFKKNDLLMKHSHNENGKIVIDIDLVRNSLNGNDTCGIASRSLPKLR